MTIKTGQARKRQAMQRKILQQAGLEKEYRRLQRKIKKEMNGAKPYLFQEYPPEFLGEQAYIIIIEKDNEFLGEVAGTSVDEVIKMMEDWLDE